MWEGYFWELRKMNTKQFNTYKLINLHGYSHSPILFFFFDREIEVGEEDEIWTPNHKCDTIKVSEKKKIRDIIRIF